MCESQALRKAFPSHVSSQASIEEMHSEIHDIDGERLSDAAIAVRNASNKLKADLLPNNLLRELKELIKLAVVNEAEQKSWLLRANVEHLDNLSEEQIVKVIDMLKERLKNGSNT